MRAVNLPNTDLTNVVIVEEEASIASTDEETIAEKEGPRVFDPRGEYFSISRDTCPCITFLFSCSYIQIRVFRVEILVRNSYA